MVALVLLAGTAKILSPGENQTVRRTFTIGLPLAGLAILMLSQGNKEIGISFLTAVIVFYILYRIL